RHGDFADRARYGCSISTGRPRFRAGLRQNPRHRHGGGNPPRPTGSRSLSWHGGRMSTRLLTCENLHAGYGASQVLFGLDFAIDEGEVIGLLGRNGMGKSTTIKNIVGLIKPISGRLNWRGRELNAMAADAIARLGIAVVPEGRPCFPNLP